MTVVTLINSRQSLRPYGGSPWVQATVRAIAELSDDSELTFACACGAPPADLTLTVLAQRGARTLLVYSDYQLRRLGAREADLPEFICAEYDAAPTTLCVTAAAPERSEIITERHHCDLSLLSISDRIYPISIRPGGFFAERLKRDARFIEKTDWRFSVPYENRREAIKRNYQLQTINPAAAKAVAGSVIHWTRTSATPAPDETRGAFYRELLGAATEYPRSAYHILRRILSERRLRASRRHAPAGAALLAFTETCLEKSVHLMKYRARYREMTFEPFGIALPLRLTQQSDLHPVRYCSPTEYATLSAAERLFAHREGAAQTNWRAEREWRRNGDLDLTPLVDHITVLTENAAQAETLSRDCGVRAYAVFTE